MALIKIGKFISIEVDDRLLSKEIIETAKPKANTPTKKRGRTSKKYKNNDGSELPTYMIDAIYLLIDEFKESPFSRLPNYRPIFAHYKTALNQYIKENDLPIEVEKKLWHGSSEGKRKYKYTYKPYKWAEGGKKIFPSTKNNNLKAIPMTGVFPKPVIKDARTALDRLADKEELELMRVQ